MLYLVVKIKSVIGLYT